MIKALELSVLSGQLLVATPQLKDQRFDHAVVFICGHDENGAMGLIINKLVDGLHLSDVLAQLNIPTEEGTKDIPVHYGGPIEMGRGFVLHSTDYMHMDSVTISDDIALTANAEILDKIAKGDKPEHCLLALGYSGWSPGQLEAELQSNSWLSVPADKRILFNSTVKNRWKRAIKKIGINPDMLSEDIGHA